MKHLHWAICCITFDCHVDKKIQFSQQQTRGTSNPAIKGLSCTTFDCLRKMLIILFHA